MRVIRRLQYIGNQYLLNVPARLAKPLRWKKGDYIQLIPTNSGTFDVQKIADAAMESDEVKLMALEAEASQLNAVIDAADAMMSGGVFSFQLADYSRVRAKIRRLKRRMALRRTLQSAPVAESAR